MSYTNLNDKVIIYLLDRISRLTQQSRNSFSYSNKVLLILIHNNINKIDKLLISL